MSLNCAEIDQILGELSLEGSFIQQIVQSSYDTIAFFTHGNGVSRTIQVTLAPGACRLHETRRKIPGNDKPLRFMEFLRSRIRGARIAAVCQLNNDRIVEFHLQRGDEQFRMYIRLWSGAANIVVTDSAGSILDVFYRRPARGEITGGVWQLPESAVRADKIYTVRDLPGAGSFNEKIDVWYGEHAASLSREALLTEARRRYALRMDRIGSALTRLEKKRQTFLNADRLRHQGDLLMANLHRIQTGLSKVEVEDYLDGNKALLIMLDPLKKPQENAARYYEQYRKAVSGLSSLEDDIASAHAALKRLSGELTALEAEQNPLLIHKTLRRRMTPVQQRDKKTPGLTYRKDGWLILVGRTAAENDELLRRHVRGSDLWLHTRDWPGGYVFVKARKGKSIPLDLLLDAGNLALFYSKGRRAGTADLYYTQVKYLRRAKGGPKGTVLPTQEKNLSVKLDDARLKNLESCREDIGAEEL